MNVIRIYGYLGPAILTPLSLALWWYEYPQPAQAVAVWSIPVLWAYIVPAIGTNVLKVWEFDVAWKLGRFRPHHGFVFGSATATLAWLVHGSPATSVPEVLRNALVLASVLGFWNLLYEVKALRAGVLHVYNQPWSEGSGPEAIAFDYSPWMFAGFGAAYGLAIGGFEYRVALHGDPGAATWAVLGLAGLAVAIALPALGFIRHSLNTHGHPGTRPVPRRTP